MAAKKELIVTDSEISKVKDNALSIDQLNHLLKYTPEQYIKKRPAKGGGEWFYVSGGYVKNVLNLMFGWDWDFEIIEEKILHSEAVVKGKLTVRSGGRTIIKMQYGNKDIAYKRQPNEQGEQLHLSIGNDLKAAATDALKKCASELGIAADIYWKEDFESKTVVSEEDVYEKLVNLFKDKKSKLTPGFLEAIERVINNKEKDNYTKSINHLNTIK